MWLLTSFIVAIIATLLSLLTKNKYKLGFLSLMLWGGVIMILVDHVLGYEGGAFFETSTEGIIQNATWLGCIMLVPVLLVWAGSIIIPKLKN